METRRNFLRVSLPTLTASSLLMGATDQAVAFPTADNTAQKGLRASVLDFGAKGDGITDDTEAFNLAWNARKGAIGIPSGYKFLIRGIVGSVEVENDTKWIGEGAGGVVLIAHTGGFEVSGANWGFENVHFFSIGTIPFAIKTGILSGNRSSYLRRCSFRSNNVGDFFEKCCELNNVWYSDISQNYINQSGQKDFGKTSVYGVGLELNYCVNNLISNNNIGSCKTGIHVTSDSSPVGRHGCEGLLINNNVILANKNNLIVDNGYYINVTGNVIDIPLCKNDINGRSGNPLVFRCMQGIVANNWISVADSTIIVGRGKGSLTYDGTGNIFSGNIIRGISGRDNSLLTAESGLDLFVCIGNQFTFGKCAIVSNPGVSSRWKISNNIFSAQSGKVYDISGVSAAEVVDNLIYSKLSRPMKVVKDDAYVRPKIFSKTISLQLPFIQTGGSTDFSVPVPPGVFMGAPEYASAQVVNLGSECLIDYKKDSSTATILKFSASAVKKEIKGAIFSISIFASDSNSSF